MQLFPSVLALYLLSFGCTPNLWESQDSLKCGSPPWLKWGEKGQLKSLWASFACSAEGVRPLELVEK